MCRSPVSPVSQTKLNAELENPAVLTFQERRSQGHRRVGREGAHVQTLHSEEAVPRLPDGGSWAEKNTAELSGFCRGHPPPERACSVCDGDKKRLFDNIPDLLHTGVLCLHNIFFLWSLMYLMFSHCTVSADSRDHTAQGEHLVPRRCSVYWMRESISTQIVFLAKLFARIIDSYALIGNGTERPHAPFTQFPPIVTSCITTVQHHHQETVLESIHGWWSPRLTCDLIVFVSPFFPGKIPCGPSPQHPFCYCFTPTPTLLFPV